MQPTLAICVATFRRPEGLRRLVASLEAQALGPATRRYALEVRVVDNAPEGSAAALASELAARSPLRLRYRHEPEPNIARARNAALDFGPAEVVVFVDDDEVADPDWLELLLAEHERSGADAVLGTVERALPEGAPSWLERGGFFASVRPEGELGWNQTRTGNTLVRGAWIYERGFRFDEEFGRSGGEDVHFFARLAQAGARFRGLAAAKVAEEVEPERLNLRYLLRRAWRQGQIITRVQGQLALGRHPLVQALGRCAHACGLLGAGLPSLAVARPETAARALLRLSQAGGGLQAWLQPAAAPAIGYGGASCASPS